MATGLANGKGQFSTPIEVNTPQTITKNFGDPTAVPNLVHIRSRGLGFWANGRNITKILFIYLFIHLYPLLGNSPAGQTRRQIFAHGDSDYTDSCKDVPFGGLVDMAPHFGGQISPKPQLSGMNRRFQAKLAKSKNMHIIKTTASIPTKFFTVTKAMKCPSLMVRTLA